MHLFLDLERLRTSIALWRHVLAMPGQAGDQPASAIGDVRSKVAGWADLLRLCSADPEPAQLDALRAEVEDFLNWLREAEVAVALLGEIGFPPERHPSEST